MVLSRWNNVLKLNVVWHALKSERLLALEGAEWVADIVYPYPVDPGILLDLDHVRPSPVYDDRWKISLAQENIHSINATSSHLLKLVELKSSSPSIEGPILHTYPISGRVEASE